MILDKIKNHNEAQLVDLLLSGDQQAFEVVVKKYQSRVYNVCLSFLKIREDADDLAQEVFVLFYQKLSHFKGDSSISTWLYRLAVNKSLEELRRRKSKKRWSNLLSLWSKEEELGAKDFVHPGVQLERKELSSVLFYHIENLPEGQKVAFTLQKVEGLTVNEIAEIMENSVSAVESLLIRAKANLKKMLETYYHNYHE